MNPNLIRRAYEFAWEGADTPVEMCDAKAKPALISRMCKEIDSKKLRDEMKECSIQCQAPGADCQTECGLRALGLDSAVFNVLIQAQRSYGICANSIRMGSMHCFPGGEPCPPGDCEQGCRPDDLAKENIKCMSKVTPYSVKILKNHETCLRTKCNRINQVDPHIACLEKCTAPVIKAVESIPSIDNNSGKNNNSTDDDSANNFFKKKYKNSSAFKLNTPSLITLITLASIIYL